MKNKTTLSSTRIIPALMIATALCASTSAPEAFATEKPEVSIGKFIMTADTLQHSLVGPGTYYTGIQFNSTASSSAKGQIRVFYFTCDATNPMVDFSVELGRDSLIGGEPLSTHINRLDRPGRRYFGAVNGDFYHTSGEVGRPVYGSVISGKIGTAPIAGVPHFVISDNRVPWCTPLTNSCNIAVDNGPNIAVADYNISYSTAVTLYNSNQGRYTHCPSNISQVPFQLLEGEKWQINTPFKARITGEPVKGECAIPADGGVIAAGESVAEVLNNLPIGKEITITIKQQLTQWDNITPAITGEVGSSILLVANGVKIPSTNTDVHPRTVMGCTTDRKKIILMAVDGRSTASYGGSYDELSDLMIYAGAEWAVNADGGGSTSLYMPKIGTVNRPSDGSERAVGDGLYLVLNAPDDNQIARIEFMDWNVNLPQYGIYTPRIYGFNKYGLLIDTDVKDVRLVCDPSLGEPINDDKTFFANGHGYGALHAIYGEGIEASIPVNVEASTAIEPKYSNVLLDNYRSWTVDMQSMVNGQYLAISPRAFSWSTSADDVASVDENGVVKGHKDGSATLAASLDEYNGAVDITVECPTNRTMQILADADFAAMKKTFSGAKTYTVTPDENGGFGIDFHFSSVRGPVFTLTTNQQIWSLPDALQVVIDPGNAKISSVTLSTLLNNSVGAKKATIKDFGDSGLLDITIPVSDLGDANDVGIYPIRLSSFAITFSGDTTTDYHIDVKAINAIYNNAPDGVEPIIGSTDGSSEVAVAYYNLQGTRISNPTTGNIIIRVATLSDGSIKATKILSR